jgi:hypothetical protein
MRFRKTVLAATLTLGLVASASAGTGAQFDTKDFGFGFFPKTTLWTPPLLPQGKTEIDCYIINVSHKPRWVQIQALDREGDVVGLEWKDILGPSQEAVVKVPAGDGLEGPRSCRFTVEGTKDYYRASGLVVLPGLGSISALEAH